MTASESPHYPFMSRAYGGFTRPQETFFRGLLGDPSGKCILDPMAGQAFCLSQFAHEGADLHLGDINPALLLLASLRDPNLFAAADQLSTWLQEKIATVAAGKVSRALRRDVVEEWIAPSVRTDLRRFAQVVEINMFADPFTPNSEFWEGDYRRRFAAAIAVLAARELACFRVTDNVTWLKPGGLVRECRIAGPLRRALTRWTEYARSSSAVMRQVGAIHVKPSNATRGYPSHRKKYPWIVTSPPYANRLDYSRMWGPELNVLAAFCDNATSHIKRDQIGSTVVEGIQSATDELPEVATEALQQIRSDPAEYSEVYYYPFFKNYASSLASTLRKLAALLSTNGTIVVFVRDTVRKDVMFPTGELVSQVLTDPTCGLTAVRRERRTIKNHIGQLRKVSSSGLHGLAQQEWWLAFQKKR